MKKYRITIPADIDYIFKVRNYIQNIAFRFNFSNKVVQSLMLAVEEICTNVIRHGYTDKKGKTIQVEAVVRRPSMTVIVIDQGKSYHPDQVEDPDLKHYVEIGKTGGLGIMMVRRLMDKIDYQVTERGNEFRMTKYRTKYKRSRFFKIWERLEKVAILI